MDSKAKIFIIEDHPVMRNAIAARFEKSRFWNVIGTASNLEDAKKLLNSQTADIILLDIQLDDGWGLDIITWLANQNESAKNDFPMPIFAVYSAFEDYAHVSAALGMGVKAYVTKRRDEAFLKEVLHNAFEKRFTDETFIDEAAQAKLSTVTNFFNLFTKRESEIFTHVKRGLSNKQIAEQLGISIRTVENILCCIYDKTGVQSRFELERM